MPVIDEAIAFSNRMGMRSRSRLEANHVRGDYEGPEN